MKPQTKSAGSTNQINAPPALRVTVTTIQRLRVEGKLGQEGHAAALVNANGFELTEEHHCIEDQSFWLEGERRLLPLVIPATQFPPSLRRAADEARKRVSGYSAAKRAKLLRHARKVIERSKCT